MKKQLAIYLAGPDVFREKEKVKEVAHRLKAICAKYGHSGHFPLDNLLTAEDGDYASQAFSFSIFRANIELMDRADVIVANLEPFRGPGVDDGTAFEIGYGFSKGKIVYGYSDTAHLSYPQIYETFAARLTPDHRQELEHMFPQVEDFKNNTSNLMLVGAIHDSGGKICSSFEACIADLTERHS